jgi:hypothetical protein
MVCARARTLSLFVETTFPLLDLYFIQRLKAGVPAEEDPSFDEVGKRLSELVFGKNMSGDAENLV